MFTLLLLISRLYLMEMSGVVGTVFPLISTPDANLNFWVLGAALIRGWRLKEGGAYFKVIEMR